MAWGIHGLKEIIQSEGDLIKCSAPIIEINHENIELQTYLKEIEGEITKTSNASIQIWIRSKENYLRNNQNLSSDENEMKCIENCIKDQRITKSKQNYYFPLQHGFAKLNFNSRLGHVLNQSKIQQEFNKASINIELIIMKQYFQIELEEI